MRCAVAALASRRMHAQAAVAIPCMEASARCSCRTSRLTTQTLPFHAGTLPTPQRCRAALQKQPSRRPRAGAGAWRAQLRRQRRHPGSLGTGSLLGSPRAAVARRRTAATTPRHRRRAAPRRRQRARLAQTGAATTTGRRRPRERMISRMPTRAARRSTRGGAACRRGLRRARALPLLPPATPARRRLASRQVRRSTMRRSLHVLGCLCSPLPRP